MADTLEPLRAALADRYAIERELGRGGNAQTHEGPRNPGAHALLRR